MPLRNETSTDLEKRVDEVVHKAVRAMVNEINETAELMYCASVIPRRAERRARKAIEEGRPEDALRHLEDIRNGVEHLQALYQEATR